MLLAQPGFFVDGEWLPPSGSSWFDVICPSTEEPFAQGANASIEDVDRAVRCARRAFLKSGWGQAPVADRMAVIERARTILQPKVPAIARLITTEMGQPITTSCALTQRAVDLLTFYNELAGSSTMIDVRRDQLTSAVMKEPVGVVAAIAPWNGPFNMSVTKIIPALLTGCSVVFKPAPETPFDVAYLVDALDQAGVPSGVLNLVTGGRETGEALVRHPEVDKVSFTGSSVVGRQIGAIGGGQLKRLQLELGGKSAAILLPDADLAVVQAALAVGCFFNSGQVCAALSRVLAPRSIYADVVATLSHAAATWVVGDPFEPATTLGPLVSERQRDRVEAYLVEGLAGGARVVCGGRRPENLPEGFYIEPTVFADVDNSMTIAREEIFGPVVCVIPYDTEDEAIAIANDNDYGLHGAVFTADHERALDVARRVKTGTFTINNFSYNNRAPFGGVKASGIGRDAGREGFESYFELKTVNLPEAMAARLLSGAE